MIAPSSDQRSYVPVLGDLYFPSQPVLAAVAGKKNKSPIADDTRMLNSTHSMRSLTNEQSSEAAFPDVIGQCIEYPPTMPVRTQGPISAVNLFTRRIYV